LEAVLQVQAPGRRIDAQERRVATIDVAVAIQVIVEGDPLAFARVPRLEGRDFRRDVDVLRIRRGEDAAVRRLQIGHVQHLFRPEVAQIDHADAAVRAVVDIEPAAVVVAVGLAQCRMV
jgi:hypothetical protein